MKRLIFAAALTLAAAACADNTTAPHNDCTINPRTRKVPVCIPD